VKEAEEEFGRFLSRLFSKSVIYRRIIGTITVSVTSLQVQLNEREREREKARRFRPE
jgi:hypothetical protein